MLPTHDVAASTAAATTAKVVGIWAGVAAGFTGWPWGQIAAALAAVYSVHLIVGWWLDRLRGGKRGRR